jgi:hypothetical protein
MTVETSKLNTIAKQMINTELFTESYLALFLIEERSKGDESEYKEYLNTLPNDFSLFPQFYGSTELDMLKNSSILGRIIDRKK